MRRLVILLLVAAAAWYGWKKWPEFVSRRPGHEVVIENSSGMTMERVRVSVDGQTFVKEELGTEQRVSFPFKVANDASFRLTWEWKTQLGEKQWSGGLVPRGPMVQRHLIQVDAEGGVTYSAQNK